MLRKHADVNVFSGIMVTPSSNPLDLCRFDFYAASYSAFCRQYGNHCTNAVGSRCWNDEAVEEMKTDVFIAWSAFHQILSSDHDNMVELIKRTFEQAISSSTCLVLRSRAKGDTNTTQVNRLMF